MCNRTQPRRYGAAIGPELLVGAVCKAPKEGRHLQVADSAAGHVVCVLHCSPSFTPKPSYGWVLAGNFCARCNPTVTQLNRTTRRFLRDDDSLGLTCRVALAKPRNTVLDSCHERHSLRSSDLRFMQCDELICKGVEKGEVRWVTHLSSLPSTAAICPGPVMDAHCNIDMAPQSQGIRVSISMRFDIADQHLKANTGVLLGSASRRSTS